jgi:hypothetical protein
MAKDSEIKFRCDVDLRVRFERIAALERRNPADLGRIVFEDYVAAQEQHLGLSGNALREVPPPYKISSSPASAPTDNLHKLKSVVFPAVAGAVPAQQSGSAPSPSNPKVAPDQRRKVRKSSVGSPVSKPVSHSKHKA